MKIILKTTLDWLCLRGKIGRKILKIRNRIGFDREEVAWVIMEIVKGINDGISDIIKN